MRFLPCLFFLLSLFLFVRPDIVVAEESPVSLQKQLEEIERQISQDQLRLKDVQGEAKTLSQALRSLQQEQDALVHEARASELRIGLVEAELAKTRSQVDENVARRLRLRTSIAEYLRRMHEIEGEPELLSFFRHDNVFGALNEWRENRQVTDALQGSVLRAKQIALALEEQETELEREQEDMRALQRIRTLQEEALADRAQAKRALLAQTRGEEEAYQDVLAGRRAEAAEVRGRLYKLLDVSTDITFGEAVKIAQWAESATGVRAAFLLAVLTQESNLGSNVGTCNRLGDPLKKHWTQIMKRERDQEPFQALMASLGRSTEYTPVSCPMFQGGKQIGWGGAMGPAQFIPSTWAAYQGRVQALTGKPPDPWDIRDAFAAAAVKLAGDGAKTREGEWAAAMRYFSGSTNLRFRFYGDQVVARAADYQTDMDSL